MDANKIKKKLTAGIVTSAAAFVLLLAAGLVLWLLDIHILENDKAIVGLAFIPLGMAIYQIIMAVLAKRNPAFLRSIAVEQADERLTAMKQRADSITFKTMRWALSAAFLGYTLAFPSEIFESAGWWITFAFFFIANMMQGVILACLMGKDQ